MLELATLQVLVLKLEQIGCVGGENTQAPYIVEKVTIDYDKRDDFKMALYK